MHLSKTTDHSSEISKIKIAYVTNTKLTRRLNDLKSQHIADEVKKVDDKVSKNSNDILDLESRLKQKENIVDESQKEISCFKGKHNYDRDRSQIFLVYKGWFSSLETLTGSNITKWKSSGIYDKDDSTLEAVNTICGSAPRLRIASENGKLNVRFNKKMLKESKVAYSHDSVVKVYTTFRLRKRTIDNPYFTVGNCLFGAVKIQNDVNTSHYKYSGYGIAYDHSGSFSYGNNSSSRSLIIFVADMSFSSHATNRLNNIYVLGKDFIQGVNGTTIYAERMYKTDPSVFEKMYVMSIHYNGDDSYLFINGTQELKFKAKDSEIKRNKLCIGNISEDFSVTIM